MTRGVSDPLFMGSQWHDCKNASGSSIPPYGVAETVGMTTITVDGVSKPAISVQAPTTNNPEKLVFTGPMGCPAGGTGICHAEVIGYAAHSGTLSTSANYGLDDDGPLLQEKVGNFRGIGGTFTSGGNSVSLFYRTPNTGAKKILFTIVSASGSSATVQVNKATCNLTEIDGIGVSCLLTVYDDLGCLLSAADSAAWVGKKGTAVLMQSLDEDSCEPTGSCRWVIDALCCP
ncbi:MAG: hypothetical protein CMK32_10050 [Porticoccaceae bacterium]|nr:hypothetical protein [Porticoccaceae bacterium]